MIPKRPVTVVPLFPEERERLLELLKGLSPGQFRLPTSCPGWAVHDLVSHVIGDNLAGLSGGRDAHSAESYRGTSWPELVDFINQQNEAWVVALRRLSPRVLIDLLESSGGSLDRYFGILDPMQLGPNVAWVGEGPMPMWLHIAREYTERWVHQSQIREALEVPMLDKPRFLHPVLDTFVHALPNAYQAVDAPPGTHVEVEISGDAGGSWSLVRHDTAWMLMEDVASAPTARVKLDQDTAWRLWTRGIRKDVAAKNTAFSGAEELCHPTLRAVAMIV